MKNITITDERKSTKAIPGAPCGNMENNRCMV